METRILKVKVDESNIQALGHWKDSDNKNGTSNLNTWEVPTTPENEDILAPIREAAHHLRTTDIPVAFPTETVYGLGADATRSAAVKGIYAAKGRPSDNPLIVHVCDLSMLRSFISPSPSPSPSSPSFSSAGEEEEDPIPEIYHPLITRFWPGPLTILLPNPSPSLLAPEVTAGLPTFGCRMPASPLARSLIKLAGAPLAAPSANASTKPSPTAAQHVLDDLRGRIALILDGGSCSVGVESTVVDGLCSPPVVLRPGGVSLEEIRACPGWEGVEKAYKDQAEVGGKTAPRAPGMKYKHYSPKARVVLYEAEGGGGEVPRGDVREAVETVGEKEGGKVKSVAVIRTGRWPVAGGLRSQGLDDAVAAKDSGDMAEIGFVVREGQWLDEDDTTVLARLLEIDLGNDVKGVAHGLFAALRELDRRGADVIFVEGVSDGDDIAAAVMNRLRKAASDIRI
ncbi:DHBP synthase RibB-like alpha/beta domain-containing protein [Neurospora tetraspora]|uniref:Threonylcarbamoyl-AMP synthase n=1 Tax=Neurospora tetraspora TaxID=94610 RepID=A0AAE0MW09_9PEZI|nr:DHBP synthase RibB-like alpha/beta domain-containing protein [Neurospora tetraspora]